MNKYILIREGDEIISFLLDESGNALEIHIDPSRRREEPGNIYIGRIQKIVPALKAAFVDIQPGLTCYLPFQEISDPVYVKKGASAQLQTGDELLVQITRPSIKGKYPAVTTKLCLQGEYAVLCAGGSSGVSHKVSPEDQKKLKSLLDEICQGKVPFCVPPDACGLILRTNAASAGRDVILHEAAALIARYSDLVQFAVHRTCYSCLYQVSAPWVRRLLGLRLDETEKILTDDQEIYENLRQDPSFARSPLAGRIFFETDQFWSLKARFRLDTLLGHALSRKVWLGSGAFLVIDQTEALNVIDVNSGKSSAGNKRRSKEESILRVNLEAAAECARQIRLRNLSGIILIDFISMETEESKHQLMQALAQDLKKDPVRTELIDMTRLDLVEITRKKTEKSLAETRNRVYDN